MAVQIEMPPNPAVERPARKAAQVAHFYGGRQV